MLLQDGAIGGRKIWLRFDMASNTKSAKKNFCGEKKFAKIPMLYSGVGICDSILQEIFMEKFDAENLPGNEALNCGRAFSPRRVRRKKVSLFAANIAGGGIRFRTAGAFSSYGRMNALFARQAAFGKWGSKNERD